MDERDDDEERIAWAITNLFEELEFRGYLSRYTVDKYYALFGNHCGLISLLPSPRHPLVDADEERQQRSMVMAKPKTNYDWLILFRKKDQYVDEDYLKLVQERYPSATGFAFAQDGTVAYNVVPETVPLEGDEGLINTQTVYNVNSVMCFCNSTKIADEDLQPFTLLEQDGKNADGEATTLPILMCVIHSEDWPDEYIKDESIHSPAWHVLQDYLKEKVLDIYESSDKSLDKTMQALNKPLNQKEIIKCVGKDGCVIFIGGEGSFCAISNCKTAAEYVWGTTTHHLDYKVKEPKVDKEKEGRTAKGLMSALKSATSHTPPKTEEKQPTSVPLTKQDRITVGGNGDRMVIIPEGVLKSKAFPESLKSWLTRHCKYDKDQRGRPIMQADWQKLKGVPYDSLLPGSPLRDVYKNFEALGPAMKDAAAQVTADVLPIIPKNDRDAVATLLAKYGPTSDKLWPLTKIESISTQSPSYSEQTGHSLAAACRMPQEVAWELISKHPRAAYALWYSMRNLVNAMLPDYIDDELANAEPDDKKTRIGHGKQAHAM